MMLRVIIHSLDGTTGECSLSSRAKQEGGIPLNVFVEEAVKTIFSYSRYPSTFDANFQVLNYDPDWACGVLEIKQVAGEPLTKSQLDWTNVI